MTLPDDFQYLSEPQRRAILERLLKQRAQQAWTFPASVQQQALWYDFIRDPSETAYLQTLPSRVRSPLNVDAVREVWGQISQRHGALRTTFEETDREIVQRVHPQLTPGFEVVDATGWTEAQVHAAALEAIRKPVNLRTGPLFRLTLLRRAADDWISLPQLHHIVVDFWSLVLILDELQRLYHRHNTGQEAGLASPQNNYDQFVSWQQQMITGPEGAALRRYWQLQCRQTTPVLELPLDRMRPDRFQHRGSSRSLRIEADHVQRLAQVARRGEATFQTTLLAVLQVFLHRLSGQESFFIGCPFAGRPQREFESTIGFFANMLPLAADLSGNPTFQELVHRNQKKMLEALDHQHLPFAEIVRTAQVPRDPSRNPLFQVSLAYEKSHLSGQQGTAAYLYGTADDSQRLLGFRQEAYSIPACGALYDLEWSFESRGDQVDGQVSAPTSLFDPASIDAFADQFLQLVARCARHPDATLQQLLVAPEPGRPAGSHGAGVSQPAGAAPRSRAAAPSTGLEVFAGQCTGAAEDPAILSPELDWSYGQLRGALEDWTQRQKPPGLQPGDPVLVVARRGGPALAGILAAIRWHAMVVPIDADQPPEEASSLAERIQPRFVFADDAGDRWWQAAADSAAAIPSANLDSLCAQSIAPESLASVEGDRFAPPTDLRKPCYLIFTSGSTGRPKGVVVSHRAIANTLSWRRRKLGVRASDRLWLALSHQFDAGFGIALSAFAAGAAVVFPRGPASDPEATIERVRETGVTILPAIPPIHQHLLQRPRYADCQTIRQLWTGGQTMPPKLPAQIRRVLPARIWNLYGPTEAAIEAAAADVTDHSPDRPVPIGYPVDGMEVRVIDAQLRSLPALVPGQLALVGPGLADGYWDDRPLTEAKFVTLPDGQRGYLTGDRGRRLLNGQFAFLGREDAQVKLHGYRIELEAIDRALQALPEVHAAGTIVSPANQLIAWVEAAETATAAEHAFVNGLRAAVAGCLPPYKRPVAFGVTSQLPRTTSGKVDRATLAQWPLPTAGGEVTLPRTALEQAIADVWSKRLGTEVVGIDQDFFELGGTSLDAGMLSAEMSDFLGVQVPASLVFDMASIARMARQLVTAHRPEMAERFGADSVTIYDVGGHASSSTGPAANESLLVPLQSHGAAASDGPTPLFLIHPPGGIVACYRELARRCEPERPVVAIRSHGLFGDAPLPESVTAMACDYLDAVEQAVGKRPISLGGWSLGGLFAYEAARQWLQRGNAVERLLLLDTSIPAGVSDRVPAAAQAVGQEYGIDLSLEELVHQQPEEQLPLLWEHAKKLGVLDDATPEEVVQRMLHDLKRMFHHHIELATRYRIEPIDVPTLLVRPRDVPVRYTGPEDRGWGNILPRVAVAFVGGHHHSMVQPPHAAEIANLLR